MPKSQPISPGISAGMKAGCPFCLAGKVRVPEIGETIRVLSGLSAGVVGKVVPSPPALASEPYRITIRVNGDPPDTTQMLNTRSDLFERFPGPPVPEWAPPLSLTEAEQVDRRVVVFCENSTSSRSWYPNLPDFYEVIRYIWYKRLPLEPSEVLRVLQAHGVPKNWQVRLTSFFREGRNLLVFAVGRKPMNKKRVKPFSTQMKL